jgi:quercetin dioxygenase-like cupin family protein
MLISINADRTQTVLVEGGALPWIASPEPGVERRMLERSGGEMALATSIVRYAAGSRFPPHTHDLGEEFLVLAGTFSDDSGDFSQGTYVRNPPGSRHAPFSRDGCVILVKLRQMTFDEVERVRVFPAQRCRQRGDTPGIEESLLHSTKHARVSLLRMAAGAQLPARIVRGGEELFVVEGEVQMGKPAPQRLGPWSWRRSAESKQPALASAGGALLWIKRGHL